MKPARKKAKRKKKAKLIGFRGEAPSYDQRLREGFRLMKAAYRFEEE